MFQRDISEKIVEKTIKDGKIIETYLDDKPYPSFLILGFDDISNIPIHVVFARNNNEIIIITVYSPSRLKWADNYQTRIK